MVISFHQNFYTDPIGTGVIWTDALHSKWSLQNATSLIYGAIAQLQPIEYNRNVGMFRGTIIAPELPNNQTTIPEPATMLLFGLGLLGLAGISRKKK